MFGWDDPTSFLDKGRWAVIVDSDGEKSHLASKQKQIPISYVKLNIMMVLIYFSEEEGGQSCLKKNFVVCLK